MSDTTIWFYFCSGYEGKLGRIPQHAYKSEVRLLESERHQCERCKSMALEEIAREHEGKDSDYSLGAD